MLRLQHGAGRQHHRAGRHVLTGKTTVGAEFQPLWHGHTATFDRYIFLHENRVGALGYRRAGENTNGLAGFQGKICTRAGRKSARNRQRRISVRTQVRVSHRISINGGIVERWKIDWSFHIAGHNATASAMQRHTLSLGDRCDPFCNQPLHIIEPQERT